MESLDPEVNLRMWRGGLPFCSLHSPLAHSSLSQSRPGMDGKQERQGCPTGLAQPRLPTPYRASVPQAAQFSPFLASFPREKKQELPGRKRSTRETKDVASFFSPWGSPRTHHEQLPHAP